MNNRRLRLLVVRIITILLHPIAFARFAIGYLDFRQGHEFGLTGVRSPDAQKTGSLSENPLVQFYLDGHHRGMTKWCHYLEAYRPHFERLRRERVRVRILEIGVFSGGSLDLYRDFFGAETVEVVGVDIDPECRSFEQAGVTIELGDQEDREFWKGFVRRHAPFDIILDDGGHTAEQQVATIECLFDHVTSGGLYIVEDTLSAANRFVVYMAGVFSAYNSSVANDRGTIEPTALQQVIGRIEVIPGAFLFVRNAADAVPRDFSSPWTGASWTAAARGLFRSRNDGREPPVT